MNMSKDQEKLIERWMTLDADLLLKEIFQQYGDRVAIGTSFQKTGVVSLDLAHHVADKLRVFTVDTGRLFAETHAYMDTLRSLFNIEFEIYSYDPQRMQVLIDKSPYREYLFLESQVHREACCRVRKVLPRNEALRNVDVWITGLRREQSAFRASMKRVEVVKIEGRPIIKVLPLFEWTDQDVDRYISEHKLPVHPLYAKGFKTIGCDLPCSTPSLEGEDKRAGRWRWEVSDTRECTLHLHENEDGAGI